MNIVNKKVDDLIPYINNPRNNDAAVDAVASSIKSKTEIPVLKVQNSKVDFYFINENGILFSFWNNGRLKRIKPRTHSNGYLRFSICGKDVYAHRLVAEAYIKNVNGYKEINHIDGNKKNNCVINLEWCTRQQNNKHAFLAGLRSNESMRIIANNSNHADAAKKQRALSDEEAKEAKTMILEGTTDASIAKAFGVSRGCIYNIRTKKAYKEIWA